MRRLRLTFLVCTDIQANGPVTAPRFLHKICNWIVQRCDAVAPLDMLPTGACQGQGDSGLQRQDVSYRQHRTDRCKLYRIGSTSKCVVACHWWDPPLLPSVVLNYRVEGGWLRLETSLASDESGSLRKLVGVHFVFLILLLTRLHGIHSEPAIRLAHCVSLFTRRVQVGRVTMRSLARVFLYDCVTPYR